MKSYFNIVSLRGTIFLPQIIFDWTFVSEMLKILPNYVPTNNTPQIINGVIVNSTDWMLGTQDGTERLIFQPQKIDFILNKESSYSERDIDKFSKKCDKIFSKILELRNAKASRLAIAPTFKYIGGISTLKSFIQKIYATRVFKEEALDNCEFSQVYRVNENIGDSVFKINYLSKFYTSGNIVIVNGVNTIQEYNLVDFDINTFNDNNYSFDIDLVKTFFSKSSGFCSDFMTLYF